MNSSSKSTIIGLTIAAASLAAVVALSSWLETVRPRLPEGFQDTDLALNARRLKGFALGAEGMIADAYWITSLQYLGSKFVENADKDIDLDNLRPLNPRLLYPYLDAATELDPKFFAAYSYGAVVLPAIDPDQAIALTEKGIRHNPDKWRLHQYLGYIHWRRGDYEKAAETYEAGSQVAGAPAFFKQMAALMRSQGGSRETARAIYRQILAESEDEQSKRSAELWLSSLNAEDELDAINSVLAELHTAKRCPARLSQINSMLAQINLPAGRGISVTAAGEPADPTGVPYVLDAEQCKASLSERSALPRVNK